MEQKHFYTDEKNAQIVIALLKAHGIRFIVISPGATNDCFVLSVQGDDDFTLFSAVDERHAAYLACGIAEESGEPVVLSCTGATASRNYMPALTEAYYRKLPLLVITSSQHYSHLGNMFPQMTDRFAPPADTVKLSVQCPIPHTTEEVWDCELKVNRAILEMFRHGGGPVHINLETAFSAGCSFETLPAVRRLFRIMPTDQDWPVIPQNAKVAVWVGSHLPMGVNECRAIEDFAVASGSVVLGDLSSNYNGRCFVNPSLLCFQKGAKNNPEYAVLKPELIIHIGEISGDYATFGWLRDGIPVWRVNPDGELRDFFKSLQGVFEMSESAFFSHYAKERNSSCNYVSAWNTAMEKLVNKEPAIPFSGVFVARELAKSIPGTSELHLGILNPIRCANLFRANCTRVFCNVGGFGIDGNVSSMIGASLVHPERLYFGVVGDLSFFYDLNSVGSRHVGKNLRILVVNNGEGGEFSVPGNIVDREYCGKKVHDFIAAKGHFGKKSRNLLRHYATDLGFEYLCSSSEDELHTALSRFVSDHLERPVILECFTDVQADRDALVAYANLNPYEPQATLRSSVGLLMPPKVKNIIKKVAGI